MDGPIRIQVVSDGTKPRLVEFPRLSFEDVDKPTETTTTRFPWDFLNCFLTRARQISHSPDLTRTEHTPTPRISVPPSIPPLELLKSKMTSQIDAKPYSWPIEGGFNPRTTALVIIDMQKDCKLIDFLAHRVQFKASAASSHQLHYACSYEK
jgi:hypothetical protein